MATLDRHLSKIDTDLGVVMLAALPHPWCTTCNHTHVSDMPAHTWACHQCGFGSWGASVAAWHTRLCPTHETYPVLHTMRLGGAR